MSELRLFRIAANAATELPVQAAQVERSLQRLFETNLEALLGVRFLASEYTTGPVHGGRIDTLGIDEDGSPVIIEYKRTLNENVINQGLFYLDWLLDHRREFQWLVMDKLGKAAADAVEWSAPRLLCIAGDFTRYDNHAVKQIARNIELLRYRRFGDDLLMIEPVHASRAILSTASASTIATVQPVEKPIEARDQRRSDNIDYRIANAPAPLRDLWDSTLMVLQALGDDVQVKELKFYVAFKRIKNFACLELYPTVGTVLAHLKLDPDTVVIEAGFTRDMRGIGHFGTGDLQVILSSPDSLARAQPLFQRAYDGS